MTATRENVLGLHDHFKRFFKCHRVLLILKAILKLDIGYEWTEKIAGFKRKLCNHILVSLSWPLNSHNCWILGTALENRDSVGAVLTCCVVWKGKRNSFCQQYKHSGNEEVLKILEDSKNTEWRRWKRNPSWYWWWLCLWFCCLK